MKMIDYYLLILILLQKQAPEMIALSYKKSFKMNITIVRSNNLYGIRQYPEKLIPKTILSFLIKK